MVNIRILLRVFPPGTVAAELGSGQCATGAYSSGTVCRKPILCQPGWYSRLGCTVPVIILAVPVLQPLPRTLRPPPRLTVLQWSLGQLGDR